MNLGVLENHPIVPVLVIDDADCAMALAEALCAGGIRCAEVTLRTSAALDAVASMRQIAGFSVGVGTVLTASDIDRAADVGAEFVVSPGWDDRVVDRGREKGLTVLPGVATASEVMCAMRAGFDVVKFFPADALGGLPTIHSLAGPFPGVGFVPSGGVSNENCAAYLAHPNVPAVSGSWMAPRGLIASGDFQEVQRLSAGAVKAAGAPL